MEEAELQTTQTMDGEMLAIQATRDGLVIGFAPLATSTTLRATEVVVNAMCRKVDVVCGCCQCLTFSRLRWRLAVRMWRASLCVAIQLSQLWQSKARQWHGWLQPRRSVCFSVHFLDVLFTFSNMKPGDWMCTCGEHVFAYKDACRKCKAPKPQPAASFQQQNVGHKGNVRPGDWQCEWYASS
jgi:hypothetical protein